VAELREALTIGRRDHQPSDPHQAQQVYRQALRADPDAAASFPQALQLKPDDAEAQNNLGIALAQQGRLDEAAACFQQAVRLKPDYPDAHNNLGNILEKQDKLDEALACYYPGTKETHCRSGFPA
jgi:Flp pilus assembly protein TadD